MMLRVPRYPPLHARLIRLEEGPPMYRMLGYADKSNVMSDLCDVISPGFMGPFSMPRLPSNQTLSIGPGRFGLPTFPLPYTTVYYDDQCIQFDCLLTPYHRLDQGPLPEVRLEEMYFPEMAVPGTGKHSRVTNSGFLYREGLPPPRNFMESNTNWNNLQIHSGSFTL